MTRHYRDNLQKCPASCWRRNLGPSCFWTMGRVHSARWDMEELLCPLGERQQLAVVMVKEQREFAEVSLPEVAGHSCDDVLKVQGRKDLVCRSVRGENI